MQGIQRKRVALVCAGLGAVAAAGLLTFGGTNALFTSNAGAQDNNITAGTMKLSVDSQSAPWTYSHAAFMPGDQTNYNPYILDYAGTDPAFVGLDVTVTSKAAKSCGALSANTDYASADVVSSCTGTGTLPMFDGQTGAGAIDLNAYVGDVTTNPGVQLATNTTLDSTAGCHTNRAKVVTCDATLTDVLVPLQRYGDDPTSHGLQWNNNDSVHLRAHAALPLDAGNEFQGSTFQMTLQGHAVQWENNNATAGGSPTCDSDTKLPADWNTQSDTPCPVKW